MEKIGLTPEEENQERLEIYKGMIFNREKYIRKMKRRLLSIKIYFLSSLLMFSISIAYFIYEFSLQTQSEAHYIILLLTSINISLSAIKYNFNDTENSIKTNREEIDEFHKLINKNK